MPIFMDRHDMRYTTAEDVARAHLRDLEIQDRYGVKYLTYWYDHSRGTGFCLVDAPDAATAERVHREAHGQIATDVIEVDLAAVEAFLGRIGDPKILPGAKTPSMDGGLRAVMFTDIVGSTEMTARLGDVPALELIQVHDALVRQGLARFGGREIKHMGDGIMAAFEKAERAVRAAADIQNRFAIYNDSASQGLIVRIGIHAGEPVFHHNDLFGTTVQLASRLCREAEAESVLVSGFVRELCHECAAHFVALGDRQLKGFIERVPVYQLAWRAMHASLGSAHANP